MSDGSFRCSRFSTAAEAVGLDLSLIGDEIDKLLVHRFDPFGNEIQPVIVIDLFGEVVRQI